VSALSTEYTRCDLHLHSSASSTNDEWYSRWFGCPESYADPVTQYERCKARGMHLVTLTDHDTIAGGLQLVDRPDFFLSEEVSTVFPEDGCAIHVLAWNITPAQHERLQLARGSVYDLVDVLRGERIAHACAHPLFSPNWKLTVEALERILVLFPVIEGVNGLTDHRLQRDLEVLLAGIDERVLDELAGRHGLKRAASGRHVLTAGSDDHVTRQCASCFVEIDGAIGAHELLDRVLAGDARTIGRGADLEVMQAAVGRVTYSFLDARKLERRDYCDPFLDLVDTVAGKQPAAGSGMRGELLESILRGAARAAITPVGDLDVSGIARVHDGLLGRALDELYAAVVDVDMYRAFGALRDLAAAAATAIPFACAARHFAKQRVHASRVLAEWRASPRPEMPTRLAIFSDTLDHVDGVSMSVRRFVEQAARHGCEVRIPYCGVRAPATEPSVAYAPLPSATSFETGLYAGLELHVPSLIGTLEWLWRQDITHVELATPGPMGIVGMIAARIAQLPVTATYHTELSLLVPQLSVNPALESVVRWLTRWFYGAADSVVVFSETSRQRLVELGIPSARLKYVAAAIDPEEFSPRHAHPDTFRSFGIGSRTDRVVLAVGRLSPEKNLRVIVDAVARLQHEPTPPVLVIVGDGPERAALEAYCANKPFVVLAGPRHGKELQQLYATANAFAFASRVDTLGLVAMEAMASGVPVVVPSGTAIAELIAHGVSGYVYEFGVEGLAHALGAVLACPTTRGKLAANARRAMIDRWTAAPFQDRWGVLVTRPA
jgi:glycosyltransferase involved in cell wall biosynthesis